MSEGAPPQHPDAEPAAPVVRVGPAGWSYADWEGIVYPKGAASRRLHHVAELFRAIEINSSFYGPPAPRAAAAWATVARERPGFRFTAKLVKLFTHEDPSAWTLAGRDQFRAGVEPLREAGVLGPLLCQFPWFYACNDANLRRLARIRKAFPEHTLVLEVRHASWIDGRALAAVSELGYSFCNVDQPASRTSIPLGAVVTGPMGYLRLHGRNAEKWFQKEAAVHEKYDYLYRDEELRALLATAEELRARTAELYVIANNHYAGKGPANALEIQAALTGEVPAIPASLLATYPQLGRLVGRDVGA